MMDLTMLCANTTLSKRRMQEDNWGGLLAESLCTISVWTVSRALAD